MCCKRAVEVGRTAKLSYNIKGHLRFLQQIGIQIEGGVNLDVVIDALMWEHTLIPVFSAHL